jgi:hypothetical protein
MFNHPDFYPTPEPVIAEMLYGINVQGKIILEPSAGKGNIVDQLIAEGAAEILACETLPDLRHILKNKCRLVGLDFLDLQSHQISHVDFIIMNPPFSKGAEHIEHAFNIAPPGCQIIALCNHETVKNSFTSTRKRLMSIISEHGSFTNLGSCFANSERETFVTVALVKLQKPGTGYQNEFEGFYLDEDKAEDQENAVMPYNVIRDLVNRYVASIKIFDQQLDLAVQMNQLTKGFYSAKMGLSITNEQKPIDRNTFKKEMQKSGWQFIFNKMDMGKYATRGLREDINTFVEKQTHIPFTMRNIYKMLEIIVGTNSQRMDKAIIEVFDRLTKHYHENRYNVEGWKTNSHYLMTEKFILPWIVEPHWSNKNKVNVKYCDNSGDINDMIKAICYLTGMDYGQTTELREFVNRNYCEFGTWYSWGFFEIKAFKKGTMHFKFNSTDLWAKFNQRVAKIKGYPLFEHVNKNPKSTTSQPEPVFQSEDIGQLILY